MMDSIRGNRNKDYVIALLKHYLDPYFENIEFDILIHQLGTVFYIKDVQIKKDVLNRLGIPLLLRNGSISEIKISIENLVNLVPIELEVTGINIEVNSIYLTKNYQSDYISIKEQLLKKWETIHKEIFKKVKEKNSFIDNIIIKCITELKFKITNFKFVILDNSTIAADNKKIKKLEIKVSEISSQKTVDENIKNEKDKISRKLLIKKLASNIYKQKGEDTESINVGDPFIQPMNIEIISSYYLSPEKTKKPVDISVKLLNPFIVNVSKDKVKFLINLSKYFSKAQKVEKYWQYRPDIGKVSTYKEGIDVLKYAFNSVKDELKRKQKIASDTYWFQDAINIERYSQFYKGTQLLLDSNSSKTTISELKNIESKMSLGNILHCREYLFNKLVDEYKQKIPNLSKITKIYDNNLNKWLIFSRWTKRIEEEISEKIDADSIILNCINGDSAEQILKVNIEISLIIVNINRKVKSEIQGPHEMAEQIKYYHSMYIESTTDEFNSVTDYQGECDPQINQSSMLNIFQWIKRFEKESGNESNKDKEDFLKEAIIEEMKQIANSEMDNNHSNLNTNNNMNTEEENNSNDDFTYLRASNLSSTQKEEPKSSFLIPSLGRNQSLNMNDNTNNIQGNKLFRQRISSLKRKFSTSIQNNSNFNQQPNPLRTSSTIKNNKTNTFSRKDSYEELKEMYSKKIMKKIMMSIVFTNINLNLSKMRNDSLSLEAKVLSFNILDHNFSFSVANADNSSLLLSLFEKRFNDESFQIENMTFQNEQEAFETVILNYILDCLNYNKIRNQILNEFFLKEEGEFLNQFEYQFKFNNFNLTNNKNNTLLANIFTNVLVKFLYQKNMLEKLLKLIDKRLDKKYTIRSLLTPDESNLKSSLIMRIAATAISHFYSFEKASKNNQNKVTIDMLTENEERHSNNTNTIQSSTGFFQSTISNVFNHQLQEDLACVFKIIYINIAQYIFTPLISYFIFENKTADILYKNLSTYSRILKKRNFIKPISTTNLVDVKMYKKGLFFIDEDKNNYINVNIGGEMYINVSNETIAELSLMIPKMISQEDTTECFCSGNIYEDLKITYMDVYDEFLNLKNEYFSVYKNDTPSSSGMKYNSENELIYFNQRKDLISKYEVQNFKVSVNINNMNINLFDKVFFISTGNCFSINLRLKDIIISNEKINKIPITELKEFKLNKKKNQMNPELLLQLFYLTKIQVNSITVMIDLKELLLETDITIDIISALWNNIYFIPNLLVDIHSNNIIIHLSPIIFKAVTSIENFSFFRTLYKKKYRIASLSLLTRQLRKQKSKSNLADLNQVCEYTKNIEKLLCYDENVFPLKYYFINRISNSIFYSVGSRIKERQGILIHVKLDSPKSKKIFSIHIPLLIYNMRKALFYEKAQLWISSIRTIEEKEQRFFHKLKVTFNKTLYTFTYIEFLMCKNLINSIGYLNSNKTDTLSLDETKKLFNINNYCENELNLVFSRVSYYYEDTDLREQYKIIYNNKQNDISFNTFSTIKSNLTLNIERISIIFIGKNNKDIFSLIHDCKVYHKLCEHLLVNMQSLEDIQKINRENNRRITTNSNIQEEEKEEKNNEINDNTNEMNILPIKFRKISLHTIDFFIKKITLKFLSDEDFSLRSLGIIIYIKDVNYCENKNLDNINKEEKILNMFYITSVKGFISVPSYFRNKNDFGSDEHIKEIKRVKLLDTQKMLNLFNTLEKENNQLIYLKVNNIMLSQNERKVTFKFNDSFSFGLIDRPEKKIHEKDDFKIEKVIFGIYKMNDIIESNDKDIIKITSNNDGTKSFKQSDFLTGASLEIEIEKASRQKEKVKHNKNRLNIISTYQRTIHNEIKKTQLYYSLRKMKKIIVSLIKQDLKHQATIKLGMIFISLPSVIFKYIYYIQNYYKEGSEMISKAFRQDEKGALTIIGKIKQSIGELIPIEHRYTVDNNNEKNYFVKKTLKTNQFTKCQSPEILSKRKIECTITLYTIHIPIVGVVFKQMEKTSLIPFTYLFCNNVEGELIISNNIEKIDTPLKLRIKRLSWIGDVRCDNLIRKKTSKQKEDDNIVMKANIFLYKPINEETPLFNIELYNTTLTVVFKCVKELILFFEFNSQCLDENPKQNDIDFMLIRNKENNYLAEIKISNSSLIIPEDSQSANYICANIDSGLIQIRRKDINPKIALSQDKTEPPPMIIDLKTLFNVSTYQTKEDEYIPHTEVIIKGNDLNGFFCIQQVKHFLFEANEINALIKAPSQDKELSLMRKKIWSEKMNKKIVTYKPSVSIGVKGQLHTSLDVFYSIKQLVDSNFDEESNIIFLREPNANFNGIEFSVVLPEIIGKMDNFKCFKETVDESDVIRIKQELPGKGLKIDYNSVLKEEVIREKERNSQLKGKFDLFKILSKGKERIENETNHHYFEEDVKEEDNEESSPNSEDSIRNKDFHQLMFSESSKNSQV